MAGTTSIHLIVTNTPSGPGQNNRSQTVRDLEHDNARNFNWWLGIVSDQTPASSTRGKRWRYKVSPDQRSRVFKLRRQLVLLQAMKEDPPLDARCRDKFLVQSGPVNPDQVTSSVASIVGLIHLKQFHFWSVAYYESVGTHPKGIDQRTQDSSDISIRA